MYIMLYVQKCAFLHVYIQGLHYVTVQNTGVNAEQFIPVRIYKNFFLQRYNKKTLSHNSTIIFQCMKILHPAKKFFDFM